MKNLKILKLNRGDLTTPEAFITVTDNLTQLKSLHLGDDDEASYIDKFSLVNISKLKNLERLQLDDDVPFDPEVCTEIGKCKKIKIFVGSKYRRFKIFSFS